MEAARCVTLKAHHKTLEESREGAKSLRTQVGERPIIATVKDQRGVQSVSVPPTMASEQLFDHPPGRPIVVLLFNGQTPRRLDGGGVEVFSESLSIREEKRFEIVFEAKDHETIQKSCVLLNPL
jgi:hypothetical protein